MQFSSTHDNRPQTPSLKKVVGLTIPLVLLDWITAHAKETGQTKGQVILNAVREAKKKDEAEKRQQNT